MKDIKPFNKLGLTKLSTNLANAEWKESSGNQISVDFLISTLKFWKESYSWRDEEALLNKLPRFKTTIPVTGFEDVDIQFVHSPSPKPNSIPLLFLHGWPGSINEISKGLPLINNASFDVVAPSLPGWLSSTSPTLKGFHLDQCSECFDALMIKLGYEKYIIQGGDWGGHLGRFHAAKYPQNVFGLHLNQFPMSDCYPRNPSGYKWSLSEVITWALIHYFGEFGPTGPFRMYVEHGIGAEEEETYIPVLTGVSAFKEEVEMVPRAWAETKANVVFWKEHEVGGHFAMYERPEEMVGNIVEFVEEIGLRMKF